MDAERLGKPRAVFDAAGSVLLSRLAIEADLLCAKLVRSTHRQWHLKLLLLLATHAHALEANTLYQCDDTTGTLAQSLHAAASAQVSSEHGLSRDVAHSGTHSGPVLHQG